VSSTYFAEGFPYTVVNNVAEILFKELGASLQLIGLTALFHLPWNLKFLWGPFLDQYETKRRWLLAVELALTVVMVALAVVASSAQMLAVIAGCFMLMGLLSATHDIAIDGFYLEALDEAGQSRFVGYRAMAYKIASLVVRGPGLILIGFAGWSLGLLALALVMGGLLALHAWALPRTETRQRPLRELLALLLGYRTLVVGVVVTSIVMAERRWGALGSLWHDLGATVSQVRWLSKVSAGGWVGVSLLAGLLVLFALRRPLARRMGNGKSAYAAAFLDFLGQPKVGRILAFVVFFRTGESFLQKMKWPFLRDHMEMSLDEYGLANGTLGVVASFAATFAGGWLISRQGLRRWIWPFIVAQNALNLLYVALAAFGEPPGMVALTTVITLEHAGEGLGTAVFMVYLMRCCDPAHKAAHMAILTALMSVSFTVAGVASGFIADAIGFERYFLFATFATIPGMLLVPFIPFIDGRGAASLTAEAEC
jgi:PAT family beta-lactamase induction signal transducer AmpG